MAELWKHIKKLRVDDDEYDDVKVTARDTRGKRAKRTAERLDMEVGMYAPWIIASDKVPPRAPKKYVMDDYKQWRKDFDNMIEVSKEAQRVLDCLPNDVMDIIMDKAGILLPSNIVKVVHVAKP